MRRETSKTKYFAYVRKSSESKERQALSIPRQKDKILEMFSDLDIEFVEETKSAFLPFNRPHFANMMERIRKGEARGILAWHPDRLSRNEMDAATLTYMIRTGAVRELKFCSYNFDNSPEGIWMLQMALSQSQYSSAKLGKDVKVGLEKKVKMGWFPGVAKPGYLNASDGETGLKITVEDQKRFPQVRKMWHLMLTGNYSPPQILEIANNEWGYRTVKRKRLGGNPLGRSTIYYIFTDPFYYGRFEFPLESGNWYEGKHKPMITEEEFNRVQVLLGRKGKPRQRTREFAFNGGTMRCGECDAAITAEEKNQLICTQCKYKFSYQNRHDCPMCSTDIGRMTSPTILHYTYYRCTKKKNRKCSQKTVRVEQLEEQIDNELKSLQIDEDYLNLVLDHLDEEGASKVQNQTARRKSLQDELDKFQEQILKLSIEYTSPQNKNYALFTPEDFKTTKAALLLKRNELESRIKRQSTEGENCLEVTRQTFRFCAYARFHFANGDAKVKRAIFSALGSNLTLTNRKLNVQAFKPYCIIKESLPAVRAKKNMDRTRNKWLYTPTNRHL